MFKLSNYTHDGRIVRISRPFSHDNVEAMQDTILNTLDWTRRPHTPRDEAFYGDKGVSYVYSGKKYNAIDWDNTRLYEIFLWVLDEVISHGVLEAGDESFFNCCLANKYIDGYDSVGWHADNEPELVKNPTIMSLSLGETRTFKIKHNTKPLALDIPLNAGDIIVMDGAFQHNWKHSIPKEPTIPGTRTSLTFRRNYAL